MRCIVPVSCICRITCNFTMNRWKRTQGNGGNILLPHHTETLFTASPNYGPPLFLQKKMIVVPLLV
jgi:hypothetical protein